MRTKVCDRTTVVLGVLCQIDRSLQVSSILKLLRIAALISTHPTSRFLLRWGTKIPPDSSSFSPSPVQAACHIVHLDGATCRLRSADWEGWKSEIHLGNRMEMAEVRDWSLLVNNPPSKTRPLFNACRSLLLVIKQIEYLKNYEFHLKTIITYNLHIVCQFQTISYQNPNMISKTQPSVVDLVQERSY